MASYIKIDRKILEWEWWSDINTHRVFVYMLLKANWKEGNFKGIVIPRGSFVSSLKKLSEGTNLTVDEVRTAIKHLKSTNEITSKSHSKFTIFTVNNYNAYQDNPDEIPNKSQPIPKQFPTIEERKEGKKEIYKQIIDLYNNICVSFPKVNKLSDKRKKTISARLKMYGIDDFKQLFEMAEQSDFLKGSNSKDWSATFDWLITDSNMAKVLDGNYKNQNGFSKKNQSFDQRTYDYDELEKQLIANRNNKARKRKEQN